MMRPLAAPLAAVARTLGASLSGTGARGSLLVLTFHRVVPECDPLMPGEPDSRHFATQLDVLARVFTIVPLGEAIALRREGRLPRRALAITFDDGYANNCEVALPLLRARGLRATFFVATGFLDGGMMWNDRVIESVRAARGYLDLAELGLGRCELTDDAARRATIDRVLNALKYRAQSEREQATYAIAARAGLAPGTQLMMSREQVCQLTRGGMEIGAHTVSHPILARTESATAWKEIAGSRAELESVTGAPVRTFAYPNGRPGEDYSAEHVAMVKRAGFDCAVSTAWGCATPDADVYQLPRVAPWDRTTGRYLVRLLAAYRQGRPAVV
jgi:peptidoglycan/xylan/chitin deacetylase (PgdA/CDA1 family)